MRPEELAALFPKRRDVSREQYETARRGWAAFRAHTPDELLDLVESGAPALPYLRSALHRHLEQFPSTANGLDRTERQILESAARCAATIGDAFRENCGAEEAIFMGDSTYARYAQGLAECRHPLLSMAGTLRVTDAGGSVLANHDDHIELNGIDRWFGGIHLSSPDAVWRWNGTTLVR